MAVSAYAATCSGVVISCEDGEPIIGASVQIKGTTNGTITDLDGNFSLSNCNLRDTVVISYIGYTAQEVPANTQMRIELCEDSGGGGDIGGGGGCTVLPCTACQTTAWTTISAGYESRLTGGTCSGNSCSSNGRCTGQTIQYRCADGYFGNTTDGKTGCFKSCTTGCCGLITYDADNSAIIGASVVQKGNLTNGVISDVSGYFNLSNCNVGDTLIFLYVGMVRQEVVVSSSNRVGMNVVMTDDMGDGACGQGYYMDWSTGVSRCVRCPTENGITGTIPASNDGDLYNDITYCYIPAQTAITDTTGIFEYTNNCRYSK